MTARQRLRALDLGWLAGLIEGEGSFGYRPHRARGQVRHYPRVEIAMTDRDVLEHVQALLYGRGSIGRERARGPNRKPIYRYLLNGRAAIGLMFTLYPLLGQRRRGQVEAVVAKWRAGPRPVLGQHRSRQSYKRRGQPPLFSPRDHQALYVRWKRGDLAAVWQAATARGLDPERVREQLARWVEQ